MKIEIWCDSGANAQSCRRVTVDVMETYGLSDEEWNDTPDDEKDEMVKEIAWDRLDWGFRECK